MGDGSTSNAVRHLSKIHSIEGKVKLMADEMKHNKRFSWLINKFILIINRGRNLSVIYWYIFCVIKCRWNLLPWPVITDSPDFPSWYYPAVSESFILNHDINPSDPPITKIAKLLYPTSIICVRLLDAWMCSKVELGLKLTQPPTKGWGGADLSNS